MSTERAALIGKVVAKKRGLKNGVSTTDVTSPTEIQPQVSLGNKENGEIKATNVSILESEETKNLNLVKT